MLQELLSQSILNTQNLPPYILHLMHLPQHSILSMNRPKIYCDQHTYFLYLHRYAPLILLPRVSNLVPMITQLCTGE